MYDTPTTHRRTADFLLSSSFGRKKITKYHNIFGNIQYSTSLFDLLVLAQFENWSTSYRFPSDRTRPPFGAPILALDKGAVSLSHAV